MLFFFITFILFMCSNNLLLILILLEILGFIVIFFITISFRSFSRRDYFVLLRFSLFVMDGVIALCGLIMLVRYRGRDYLSRSSFLKL